MTEGITREDKFFKKLLREEETLLKKIVKEEKKGLLGLKKKKVPIERQIEDIEEIKRDAETLRQILWRYHRLVEQDLFKKLQEVLNKTGNVQKEIKKLEEEQKKVFVEELLPGYFAALLMIAAWDEKTKNEEKLKIKNKEIPVYKIKEHAKVLKEKEKKEDIKKNIIEITFKKDNIKIMVSNPNTYSTLSKILLDVGRSISVKKEGDFYVITVSDVLINDLKKELEKRIGRLEKSLIEKFRESEEIVKTAAELVGIQAKEINIGAISDILQKANEKLEKVLEIQKKLENIEEGEQELVNNIKDALNTAVDILDDIEDASDMYALLLETFVVEQLSLILSLATSYGIKSLWQDIYRKLQEIKLEKIAEIRSSRINKKLPKEIIERREELAKQRISALLGITIDKLQKIINEIKSKSQTQ